MQRSRAAYLISLFVICSLGFAQTSAPLPYRDARLSPSQRADDLLSRMSRAEKIAQLCGVLMNEKSDMIAHQTLRPENMAKHLADGIGEIGPIRYEIGKEVALRNSVQKFLIEQTRWGIPALFHDEGAHGLLAPQATSFPAPIGLACSWDEALIERICATTAHEMRARGIHHTLSPVIDICREPRWGRADETPGEDPFLNGKLGAAMVRGFQGSASGQIAPGHVMATLKHFVGHGQPEGGINRGPPAASTRDLLDAHVLPFRIALRESNPVSVMPSYNEIDGIPVHANTWVLQDILRGELGFTGLIASDYSGLELLQRVHRVADTIEDAALLAMRAGVELNLPIGAGYKHLGTLIEQGRLDERALDPAVKKMLMFKFALGLFENPYVDADAAVALSRRESSRALALEAARKSIVLLKNQNNRLPLNTAQLRSIAVIGPNAKESRLGSYSGEPWQNVTVFDGIKANAERRGARVLYAHGCQLVRNLPASSMLAWQRVKQAEFVAKAENDPLIAEAVSVAKEADVVILVLGENELIAREAWEGGHLGDRPGLELFGSQRRLFDAVHAVGKPVVVYLMNGRPIALGDVFERADAVLEGWYAGQETGNAAADIIFGDVNPSGKLTISIPRSTGHIPVYYNRKPGTRGFDYVDGPSSAHLPFGFGLSYTSFTYSPVRLSSAEITANEALSASVQVTNTGKTAGDEIVQLYIRDTAASVTRPIKELRGFKRIRLEPGETQTVSLPIDAESLAFYDVNMKRTVEPGSFQVWMAPDSATGEPAQFTVVAPALVSKNK